MSPPVRQFSFSAGEISPAMYARTDLNRYENGLRACRNMIPMRHGGLTGRPGTEYVGSTLNGGNAVRLLPFVFNETGLGQSYVLEFGNQYIAFYQNGGNVVSAFAAITNVTEDVPGVVTAPAHGFSNGDIVTISNVIGMIQLNNAYFTVKGVSANTFQLFDLLGNALDTTGYRGYVSGGTASKIYKIASPYLQADLATLKFAESADIITIVHKNYLPYELQRAGATNWLLQPVPFQPQIASLANVAASGGNVGLGAQRYAVSCVSQSGEEGFYSVASSGVVGGADSAHPVTVAWSGVGAGNATSFRIYKAAGATPDVFGYIATVVGGTTYVDYGATPDFTNSPMIAFNPFIPPTSPIINNLGIVSVPGSPLTYAYAVTAIFLGGFESLPTFVYTTSGAVPTAVNNSFYFSWQPVPNATGYNVYRNAGDGTLTFGLLFAGQASTTCNDIGAGSPNFALPPPSFSFFFSQANYNPTTVGFVQQRRCFGNTGANPVGFWLSQTGRYYGFSAHIGVTDSDAIFSSLAGEEVNAIQHIFELKFMLMLTSGAEIFVNGNGSNVVTPSAINAVTQSHYGSSPLRPLKVGDIVLFNQALGSFIRDFAFDFAIDGYRGNDISIFSAHLFEGYTIVDWAYQKTPDSIIWAVRSDGVLLSCTYVREQQVLAWARHDFTNGFVENVVSIPENGAYAVYLAIRRVINGATVRFVERMSQRIWQGPTAAVAAGTANATGDPVDATYLDCFLKYDGRNTTAATLFLQAPGGFQAGNTAYQQSLLLEAPSPMFTASMIGDDFIFYDELYVLSQGVQGNSLRLTVQSFVDSHTLNVTPSGAVPAEFQQTHIATWSHAVSFVSGMLFLAGQKVSVWADRFVVGSPLNSGISTVYTVQPNGAITLDKPYSVISVGLPMSGDVETLDLESYFGATLLASRKRVSKVAAYLYNSRTFFAGSENPDMNPDNVLNDPLFGLDEQKVGIGQIGLDEPPPLQTQQDYILTTGQWNKNGRCFLRNVDPQPFSLLALAPHFEDDSPQSTYKRV